MSSARPAPDRIGAPHALSYRFPQRRHCDADGRPSAGHAARTGAAAGCGRRIGIAFRHRQFDTDLDHDGDFRWSAGIASGAVTRQITPRFSAGLALRYDYEDWRFSRPVAFGGVAPWTHLFPFVILRWQINDRWRLGNPFPAGPAGGAGLELTYAPDAHWEFATGGGKRSTGYRLDGA